MHTTISDFKHIDSHQFTSPYTKKISHTSTIMSGNSNVGNSGVYEANEQRTVSNSQIEEEKKENRFHEGKDNSHQANDPSMSSFSMMLSYKHIAPTTYTIITMTRISY
jgi:hypothetical protein